MGFLQEFLRLAHNLLQIHKNSELTTTGGMCSTITAQKGGFGMKKSLERVLFMCVGGLLVLLGGVFLPQSEQVEAQNSDVQVFEMIKCRGVLVVDAAGEPKVVLSVGKDSGGVSVLNKAGEVVGVLGSSRNGRGVLTIASKDILDNRGVGSVHISTTPTGGSVSIFNNNRQNVGNFGVNALGNGELHTKDKNGYKTGRIP